MNSTLLSNLPQRQATAVATATGVIGATALLYTLARLVRNKRDDSTPCVPYRFPFIGSTLEYLADTEAFCKKYTEEYGPVFKAHLHGRIVFVVGGQYAEEIFTHPDMSFIESNKKFIDVDISLDKVAVEFSPKELRHLILKEMTQNLDVYMGRVYKQCGEIARRKLGDKPVTLPGTYRLARALTAHATGAVFGGTSVLSNEILMDGFENTADEALKEVIRAAPYTTFIPGVNYMYKRVLQPRFGSIRYHHKIIKRALEPEIQRRLQALRQKDQSMMERDVMNYLIERYLLDQDDGVVLSSITNWFVVMGFLGVLTTAGATSSVLYYLASYPEYIPELLEEQEHVLPKDQKEIAMTPADHKKLVKLDSFIREVFRITTKDCGHPHLHVGDKDIVLSNGTIVHPGEEVYINLWHANFHPSSQVGTANIDTFEPFRYVDQDKPAVKCSANYLAFGLGRHACPGRWFATDIIKAVVSTVIRHYDLSLAPEDDKTGTRDMLDIGSRRVVVKPKTM